MDRGAGRRPRRTPPGWTARPTRPRGWPAGAGGSRADAAAGTRRPGWTGWQVPPAALRAACSARREHQHRDVSGPAPALADGGARRSAQLRLAAPGPVSGQRTGRRGPCPAATRRARPGRRDRVRTTTVRSPAAGESGRGRSWRSSPAASAARGSVCPLNVRYQAGGAVAERGQHLVDGLPWPDGPSQARTRWPPARRHPAHLGQARPGSSRWPEAERRDHQVEAAGPRTAARPRRPPPGAARGAACRSMAGREVGRDHPGGPGRQRAARPAAPVPRPDPAPGCPASRDLSARPAARPARPAYIRPGPACPAGGRLVVGRPSAAQPSSGAPHRLVCHHASSSS